MFKNHPKGLFAAALANMGERFGFYTMMAVLTLFLMSKFGLSGAKAGLIYSIFYCATYVLAFAGGIIADRTKNFKGTILTGILTMTVGYAILAIPTPTPAPPEMYTPFLVLSCCGLFVIALGNGLFKGNLQAMVGQMYDNPEYSKMRDSGFSLFYMFINIGAIFAPVFAVAVRNWWINSHGFEYDANLSELCNGFINNTLSPEALTSFQTLAQTVGYKGNDLLLFANEYQNIFVTGFHYAFVVAVFAMLISLSIYLFNQKRFPNPTVKKQSDIAGDELSVQEIKQRLYALYAVFAVVIFFWFSFHQNGLTLTLFAKDYTDLSKIDINIGFTRLVGVELFQSINPFFVVFLTPVILAVFGALRVRGKEPSTPKKIVVGMGIAAVAFVLMILGSIGLPPQSEIGALGGMPQDGKVTPLLLTGTYFILTVAELFISPMGISFVSKVAPPKYQGMMQGLWFTATGVGNLLLFIGAIFYNSLSQATTWLLFVTVCLISMFLMLGMLKWLEKVAK